MDCSLPGSSIHGIFQARVLEWGAIAFSDTRVSLECNPEIPVAPGVEHYVLDTSLDTSLDEVYFALQ